MDHIRKHLDGFHPHKDRRTERGELMKYFVDKLNVARVRDGFPPMRIGQMGKLLEGIPTKDLYYLKSVCDQSKNFSKKFWWEVKLANKESDEEG